MSIAYFSHIFRDLMAGFQTSNLRHDKVTAGTLYNAILRTNILFGRIEAASRFVACSPSSFSSDLEASGCSSYPKSCYYVALIRAHFGHYHEAANLLADAFRKCPPSASTNTQGQGLRGFLVSLTRLNVVVQLLIGVVPELTTFTASTIHAPYFSLARSIRLGDLSAYQATLNKYAAVFERHGTSHLVSRLHTNVLNAAIRRIQTVYKSIPLSAVATILLLPSAEQASAVLTRAMHEGVCFGTITPEGIYIPSNNSTDYTGDVAQTTLHMLTLVANNLGGSCARAMRFPKKQGKTSLLKEVRSEDDLMDAFEDVMGDIDM